MKRIALILAVTYVCLLPLDFLNTPAIANDFSQFGIPTAVPFTNAGVTYDRYIVFQTNTSSPNNCATVRVDYFNSTDYDSGSFGFVRVGSEGSFPGLKLPSTPSHYVAFALMSGTYPNCTWGAISYTQAGSSYYLYPDKNQALAAATSI